VCYCHSRSSKLVAIESLYAIFYLSSILTTYLSIVCNVMICWLKACNFSVFFFSHPSLVWSPSGVFPCELGYERWSGRPGGENPWSYKQLSSHGTSLWRTVYASALKPFWVGGPQSRAPKVQGSRCQRQWGGVECGERVSPSPLGRGPPQKIFLFLSSKWQVLVHSWCKNYYIRTVVCRQHICIICYYFLIKTLRYL